MSYAVNFLALTGTVTGVQSRLVGTRRFPATELTLTSGGQPITARIFGTYGQRLTEHLRPGDTVHLQGRLYQTGSKDTPATFTVTTGGRVHPTPDLNNAHLGGHLTAPPAFTGTGEDLSAHLRLATEEAISGKPHTSYLNVRVTGPAAQDLQRHAPGTGTFLTFAGTLASDGGLHLHATYVQVHVRVKRTDDELYEPPQPDQPF